MSLATYMDQQELGDADFASLVNRDRTMVSRLRRGLLKPTLDLAADIERVTGGKVPMRSWVEPALAVAA